MKNDTYDLINIVNSGDDIEENRLLDQVVDLLKIIPEQNRQEQLNLILNMEAYKKIKEKTDIIIRRITNDN